VAARRATSVGARSGIGNLPRRTLSACPPGRT
jgi:hypothetical protein